MTDEIQREEDKALRTQIKRVLKEEVGDSDSHRDVDNEDDARYQLGILGPSADNTQMLNKINEIINEFNKTLISNRI